MWLGRKQASHGSATIFDAGLWATALRDAMPSLLYGVRLWASVSLALYVAFWLELDAANWAGTTAALVCQPSLGASMRKGWFRMIGTVVGAVAIVLISACFPQERGAFLVSLSLWCAFCALIGTLLRNFAAYAAALAGYTAAIIASDELGAVGGTNGQVFALTLDRATSICLGIVCAGVVMGLTDLGHARRRVAGLFAELSANIMRSFLAILKLAGPELPDMHPLRRELIRQVIALDPTIDRASGESAELLYHSSLLQRAVEGLLAGLASWRAAARLLFRLQPEVAQRDAEAMLRAIPQELRSAAEQDYTAQWGGEAIPLRRSCQAGMRSVLALRPQTPTQRVLADLTARVLGGMSDSFAGLILAAEGRAGTVRTRRRFRLRVPDWLPSLINAGRAFVAISTVEVFWVVSAWPSGAAAITWTAIAVVLFAPRADQAYDTVVSFTAGTIFAALFAAIVLFVLLPGVSTFVGLSLVMGLYLIPVGALAAQSWQAAIFSPMAANFVPLVAPANVMSYDGAKFSNGALAIIVGTACAAISFRLLPPLSPAFHTHRLLALSLRDLRRLAAGARWQKRDDWEDRMYGRVEALPDTAEPLQRAQLTAALAAGTEILRLRRLMHRLELSSRIDEPLRALAIGDPVLSTAWLARIDADLASQAAGTMNRTLLRARGSILVLSDLITQHAAYFGAGAL
jgi:uncharacterized membrane protein YccC